MIFFVKIGKGGKVGNKFIGHTNHSCIRAKLNHVFGIEPCPEVKIGIMGHVSSR